MAERTDQPSKVATEEAVRPADEHVVTDDREFNPVPSQADPKPKPAASSDKPDPTTDATAASDDNKQKPHRDRSAERRIKRLTSKLSGLEDDRTTDRQEIERLRTELDTVTKSTAAASPEPELKDFSSPQEYAKAFSKWETGQKAASSKPDTSGKPNGSRDPNAHAQHEPARNAKPDQEVIDFQDAGKKKLGDQFSEALETPGTAIDQDMGEFLFDSEYGAEIYVHLANNQDEAKKIFDSSSRRKDAALQSLEAKAKKGELDIEGQVIVGDDADKSGPGEKDKSKLGAQDNDNPDAKPADSKKTKAKDPPSDTRDTSQSSLAPDPENEDMDSYAARRNKEIARSKGYPV